jgi:hypothetical protein
MGEHEFRDTGKNNARRLVVSERNMAFSPPWTT